MTKWNDLTIYEAFQPQWNERTEMLYDMIPEDAIDILEFGAGICHMETLMRPHQRYTPSDLIDRGHPDTIVADLDEIRSCALCSYDAIVFSGVLEHLKHLDIIIPLFAKHTDTFVCSFGEKVGLLKFSEADVVELFIKAGFEVAEQKAAPLWTKNHFIPVAQTLFRFEKRITNE
jgi:hypothetical protein